MSSLFGHIGEFNPAKETITDYLDHLSFYLDANQIEENSKRRDILITVIGSSQFRLLKNLAAPNNLRDLTFERVCQLLTSHHEPKLPKYLQRAKFDQRNRHHNESVPEFIAALRHLSEHCEFGNNLNERLCEKFVTGINDERVQRRLLVEPELNLEKAIQLSSSILQAHSGAKELSNCIHYSGRPNSSRTDRPHGANHRPHGADQRPHGAYSRPHSADQRPHGANSRQCAHSQPNATNAQTQRQPCYRCNGPHSQHQCKFRMATCYKCNKVGHISKACRSTSNRHQHQFPQHQRNHLLEENEIDVSETFENLHLFNISKPKLNPININLHVNNRPVTFQLDTGAALSVISHNDHKKFIGTPIKPKSCSLQTYTGELISVLGETRVDVLYENQLYKLPLLVVNGEGPPLLGRNWLSSIQLNWNQIFTVQTASRSLESVLDKFNDVFGESGQLKNHSVKIHLKENATPKFCKARQPPFALRESIEQELSRLENAGIIKKVQFSDWATPVVPVRKKDNSIRLCGDYKVTVNRCVEEDRHPIPRAEDLLEKLSGGEKFTKIDFSNAYNQLTLDESSRKLTTINTHKGLYEYQRLCFGISSAPGIFQRIMDSLFKDISNCCVYFDDLFITGKDDDEHLKTLETVLTIIKDNGLCVRKDKCKFLSDSVTFLGYELNKHGLQPLPEKLRAIQDAPRPKTVHELKSFLGLLNYYSKFIPNFSHMLAPLYKLLNKDVPWHWCRVQDQAFKNAKSCITSDCILILFDPGKPIILTCDASPHGVGAVLSHLDKDGHERPIAFASRTLNSAEKKYSQLDKEACSLIFGVKRFHKYIYGHNVTIYTDHKPLLGLMGEHKALPEHASARMQRWAILLAGYSYQLRFRPGKDNNADALSRLPLKDEIMTSGVPIEIESLFNMLDKLPVSADQIRLETAKDPILKEVYRHVMSGWTSNIVDENLKPFKVREHELSIDNDCLLWGTRIIIPHSLQRDVLKLLHDTHVGIARMKAHAREWVWWSNIDSDIERTVKSCYQCQLHGRQPPKAPLHPWTWPAEPWERVHMDFAGPFLGKMFLIIADSHSKWIDVKIMGRITASDTIMELRDVFSFMGLPKTIVTDNGPTWTSLEFRQFLSANGVKHITVSPYQPSSNGLAERTVQTFKQAMVKLNKGTLREKVLRFLTRYRNTPHTTTGRCPSELVFGRKTRTHFDLLHPSLQDHVQNQQNAQKRAHDQHAHDRDVGIDDPVFVRTYGQTKERWVPGVVTDKTGPLSYRVRTSDHGVIRRHQDQLRTRTCSTGNSDSDAPVPLPVETDSDVSGDADSGDTTPNEGEGMSDIPVSENSNTVNKSPLVPVVQLRRSQRAIKPPDKLNL